MKQHKLNRDLPHSIVFYDHACVFCHNEMRQLKKRDHLQRLHLVDISSPGFEAKLWGINRDDAMQQLHVLSSTGEWLVGMAAIRHVYNEVGLGWLWYSTKLPLINYASEKFYSWFARHRLSISRRLGFYSASGSDCENGTCRLSRHGGN